MKLKIIILGVAIFINFILLQFNVFRGVLEIIIIAFSIYFGTALTKDISRDLRLREDSSSHKYPEEFRQQNKLKQEE